MHVFLVVMAVWSMAYRGGQVTPAFVQEMPSIEACKAVGDAIVAMSGKGDDANKYRCVQS